MLTRLALRYATALCAALLASACQRRPDVPPIVCPPGAEVQVVQYPGERGGGRGERCELPGGTREGPSYDYYEDGSIHSITNWSQGARHGKTTIWHPNGVKSAELEHRQFMPVGTWTTWDEEGKIVSQQDLGKEGEDVRPPDAQVPQPEAPQAENLPPTAPPDAGSVK